MRTCIASCRRLAQRGSDYCCVGCATGLGHAPSCDAVYLNDASATLDPPPPTGSTAEDPTYNERTNFPPMSAGWSMTRSGRNVADHPDTRTTVHHDTIPTSTQP